MTSKVAKKQSFTFSSDSMFSEYICRVKVLGFFKKTLVLVFVELAILHSIQIRTSLGQIVRKIAR